MIRKMTGLVLVIVVMSGCAFKTRHQSFLDSMNYYINSKKRYQTIEDILEKARPASNYFEVLFNVEKSGNDELIYHFGNVDRYLRKTRTYTYCYFNVIVDARTHRLLRWEFDEKTKNPRKQCRGNIS